MHAQRKLNANSHCRRCDRLNKIRNVIRQPCVNVCWQLHQLGVSRPRTGHVCRTVIRGNAHNQYRVQEYHERHSRTSGSITDGDRYSISSNQSNDDGKFQRGAAQVMCTAGDFRPTTDSGGPSSVNPPIYCWLVLHSHRRCAVLLRLTSRQYSVNQGEGCGAGAVPATVRWCLGRCSQLQCVAVTPQYRRTNR